MTTLADGPAAGSTPGAPATAGAPARADGVQLLGEQPGSGYRVAPALVQRSDGQVLQLTPLLYAVLAAVDGERTLDEIAEVVSDRRPTRSCAAMTSRPSSTSSCVHSGC